MVCRTQPVAGGSNEGIPKLLEILLNYLHYLGLRVGRRKSRLTVAHSPGARELLREFGARRPNPVWAIAVDQGLPPVIGV